MGIAEPLIRFLWIIAAIASWYGPLQTNGDPYIASWWHGELCPGAPAKVDYRYLGVATADRSIPFCTKIELTVLNVPKWAKGEYDHLIGRSVIVTVVDRMGKAGDGFDLWPASAKALMGSGYKRIGIVYVKARILGEGNGY